MRKLGLFFGTVVLFCLMTVNAQAQTKDYFVGKWKITVYGTPKGDSSSLFQFDRVEGKLKGVMTVEGKKPITMARIEETAKDITAYFTSDSGYEVYMFIEKKDDNNVEGSMMDMFDCKGVRVVE